ncbi:AAA family ATPase [Candidatus Magnetomoraceae bacterium gMMP-15]
MQQLNFKIEPGFINREQELRSLRNYCESAANSILFLYGSKSSGKTTVLFRLCEELSKKKYYDIKFLNLRQIFLSSYEDFLQSFFKIRNSDENAIKTRLKRQYSLFGLFRLDAFTEKMLQQKREDPFLVMKQEIKSLISKKRQPVIIIDEFHKLRDIYLPDKQKLLINELMNFFVSITKESHLCQVIIASSDAFFIEKVYNDSQLRKAGEFMELDYLKKSDVFKWLSNLKEYNKIKEYTLELDEIEAIWDVVGGSPWEIYYILKEVFEHPLTEIISKIKQERTAMIIDEIREDRQKYEPIFKLFSKKPVISTRDLMNIPKKILGNFVHNNILFYDPVKGAYGLQGKSLEWGVKGYFNN